MEHSREWAASIAAQVGRRIAYYRTVAASGRPRKMSAQDLADRCAKLGFPIGRVVIANLERGYRQTITIPELIILAAALNVSPIMLIFPLGEDHEDSEYLPNRTFETWDTAFWFIGEAKLLDDADRDYPEITPDNLDLIEAIEDSESDLSRELMFVPDVGTPMQLGSRCRDLDIFLATPEDWPPLDPKVRDSVIRDLRHTRAQLRKRNMEPPSLWSGVPDVDADETETPDDSEGPDNGPR